MIAKGVKWLLGDGTSILFWKDIWCGVGPLISLPWAPPIAPLCKQIFGVKMAHYFKDGEWKNFDVWDLSLKILKDFLCKVQILVFPR